MMHVGDCSRCCCLTAEPGPLGEPRGDEGADDIEDPREGERDEIAFGFAGTGAAEEVVSD